MIPLIFALGIGMGSIGGIMMKVGARQLGHVEINSFVGLLHFLFRLFTNVPSLIGICLYFGSAVAWSFLLTKLEISFVQPILALTYVVTPILAFFLLRESIPVARWAGIAVIIAGVVIVAKTA